MLLVFISAIMIGFSALPGNAAADKTGSSEVIHLTDRSFIKRVGDYRSDMENFKYLGDKPAIVDFYADWCSPCRELSPILEELAREYKDEIYIYKVNVDKAPALSNAFDIKSIPTLLLITAEGKIQKKVGFSNKKALEREIEALIKKQSAE